MTATKHQTNRSIIPREKASIPSGLMEFAYIDGASCAAAGAMSVSQWHALVKNEEAPQPVIRKPRFTRWRVSDVRTWLIEYSTKSDFAKDSEIVLNKARKASKAAQDKVIESYQRTSRTGGVNHG